MHQDLEMPGAMQVVGGYIAAVAVSAFTAAAAMSVGNDAPFLAMFVIGGVYIALAGLPGFALTVFLARKHGWTDWLPFVVTGGLNAMLAWLLVNGTQGFGWVNSDNDLLLASVRGGVAGGIAYWWTAHYGLRKRDVGAAAKTG